MLTRVLVILSFGVLLAMTAHAQNRLADEPSPYLRQHKDNPVEWYPWGDEALEAARERGVPIFLSVGYSTCYWCHVMERETFEDEASAEVMNDLFVNIKLDREQRPDLDTIYMNAVQLFSNGHGGWPMSVWLTPPGARGEDDPGLEPIFAGTYFPPRTMGGRIGFTELCRRIGDSWSGDRERVLEQAEHAARVVRQNLAESRSAVRLDSRTIGIALEALLRIHDTDLGGFGDAPKFPQPMFVEFLMDVVPSTSDAAVRSRTVDVIRKTLDAMALGGLHDHLGGGFHRYATDAEWRIPHFEKMLYDNALLIALYARSHAATEDAFDRRVALAAIEYVRREMTSPEGGFYSAQDAETDSKEGLTYLWTEAEMRAALSGADASFALTVFGVDQGTNFRDPHHPEEPPRNVLFLADRDEALADRLGLDAAGFSEQLGRVRTKLLEVRRLREQPGLDDKVISGWNGLMIGSLAEASVALRDRGAFDLARGAGDFVLDSMGDGRGGLLRIYHEGETSTDGFLEDYAYVIHGLIALHRAQARWGESSLRYIDAAEQLVKSAESRFGGEDGALFDTLAGQNDLLVRVMSTYDGAQPAGASVMLHNLLDLAEITQNESYRERAEDLLGAMSPAIADSPVATVNATRALLRMLRHDETLPERLGPALPTRSGDGDDVLQIYAETDRITVGHEARRLPIRVEINEGYHITGFDPGVEGLVPLEIRIEHGEGVDVRVEAPEPSRIEAAGLTLNAYEGELDLEIVLQRSGEAWRGRPLLVIEYQACTDDACLPPRTLELDVALDRGE